MRKSLMILATISLAGCSVSGDFCDVVPGPLQFDRATSAQIVATDRASAEQISAQNAYGVSACGW